jgi:hypothetical protein
MGWQDAPVVGGWSSAPLVDAAPSKPAPKVAQRASSSDLLSGIGRESASNAIGLVRGAATTALGWPGDVEQLATKYLIPDALKSQADKSGATLFPTSSDVSKFLPDNPLMRKDYPNFETAGRMIPITPGQFVKGAAKVAGAPGEAISQGVKMAIRPDAETLQLVQKARQFGIQVSPYMLSDSKAVRALGQTVDLLPLIGKSGQRTEAFDQAVIRQIGGEGERLTPQVFAQAMDRSGQTIGSIYQKTPVKESDINGALTKIDLSKETPANRRIVSRFIEDVRGSIKPRLQMSGGKPVPVWDKGIADGDALRRLDTALGKRIRSTTDGDLSTKLGEVQETLRDALQRNLSDAKDMQTLQTARAQYARGIALAPAIAKKAPGAPVSPAELMGAMTRTSEDKLRMAKGQAGDMGDLARIGQQFLEPVQLPSWMKWAGAAGLGAAGGGALMGPWGH